MLAVAWIFGNFPVRAATWSTLEDVALYREAQATCYLGYLTSDGSSIKATSGAPMAIDMVEALLSRPTLTASLYLQAVELKLEVLGAADLHEEAEGFLADLPLPLPGATSGESTVILRVLTARRHALRDDWARVEETLALIGQPESWPGGVRVTAALVQAQAKVRRPGSEAEGYAELARLVVEAPGWVGDVSELDPRLAREDLLDMDYLDDWTATKAALATLSAAADRNPLARRRYLEITAPSIHPAMAVFPEATREEMASIRARRSELAGSVGAGPSVAELQAGGMRALWVQAQFIDDLFQTGRRGEMLGYVAALEAPAGLPPGIWEDHVTAWETFGLGLQFRWSDILEEEQRRAEAFGRIPIRQNLLALACLGGAHSRLLSPGCFDYYVDYFAVDAGDPRTLRLIFDELLKAPSDQRGAFLRELAGHPDSARAMAARSIYAMKNGNPVPKDPLIGIEGEVLRDATRALDIADRERSPLARWLREILSTTILNAIAFCEGAEVREQAAANWERPVRQNPALSSYAPGVSDTLAPTVSVPTQVRFSRVRMFASGDNPEAAAEYVRSLPREDLERLIQTLPLAYRSETDYRATSAILTEAIGRGQSNLGLTSEEWTTIQVRHAEQSLAQEISREAALTTLREVATQTGGSAPSVVRAKAIVDAFEGLQTPDAYWWAMHTMILASEFDVKSLEQLGATLGPRMKEAYPRFSGELTPTDRYMHALYVGHALIDARDFAGAADYFTRAYDDPAVPLNGEPQWVAESWRLLAWISMASETEDPTERQTLARRVRDYVAVRYAEMPNDLRKEQLLRFGEWAARELGDDATFEALRAELAEFVQSTQ